MTLKEFNDLSKKYLAGNTSEDEDRFLREWQEEQRSDDDLPLSLSEESKIERRMWKNIRKAIAQENSFTLKKVLIATSIAACLILGFTYFSPTFLPPSSSLALKEKQQGIELKNISAKEETVKLEDGTIVKLSENSSLVYGKNFNSTIREVYLTGEAFFDVKRDVTRPFIVHTGDLSTEVLGTSFYVKHNLKTRRIEVEVASGKVSVYNEQKTKDNEKNGVIITKNQKVTFDEVSKNIQQGIVNNPLPIKIEEQKISLVFQAKPLKEVLASLSKLYGIEFVINNSNLEKCNITADLNNLSMFIQLELICKSIDSSYEQRGTVVFINGEGC